MPSRHLLCVLLVLAASTYGTLWVPGSNVGQAHECTDYEQQDNCRDAEYYDLADDPVQYCGDAANFNGGLCRATVYRQYFTDATFSAFSVSAALAQICGLTGKCYDSIGEYCSMEGSAPMYGIDCSPPHDMTSTIGLWNHSVGWAIQFRQRCYDQLEMHTAMDPQEVEDFCWEYIPR